MPAPLAISARQSRGILGVEQTWLLALAGPWWSVGGGACPLASETQESLSKSSPLVM